MIRKIRAFFYGMYESNSDLTWNYEDDNLNDAYDRGRYFAWRLTGREA
jgi:hypothetical protein